MPCRILIENLFVFIFGYHKKIDISFNELNFLISDQTVFLILYHMGSDVWLFGWNGSVGKTLFWS